MLSGSVINNKYNEWKEKRKIIQEKGDDAYELYKKRKILRLSEKEIIEKPYFLSLLFEETDSLMLNNNGIEKIPEGIKNFKKIKRLDLSANKIKKIPTSVLEKCRSLQIVFLRRNPISKEEVKRAKKYMKDIIFVINSEDENTAHGY